MNVAIFAKISQLLYSKWLDIGKLLGQIIDLQYILTPYGHLRETMSTLSEQLAQSNDDYHLK